MSDLLSIAVSSPSGESVPLASLFTADNMLLVFLRHLA